MTRNLVLGWLSVLAGIVSGAIVGLFFHRDDWMGGYNSFRRRMTRLGHISFFGFAFLNLMFATTAIPLGLDHFSLEIASFALIAGTISMPACCFLTAWRKPLRHLFPIPVSAALIAILAILLGRHIK